MALWDPPHLWHTSHCVRILHLATVPVTLCKGAGGDNAPHSTHSQEDTHYNTNTQYATKRNAHFRHATVSMRPQYTAAPFHTSQIVMYTGIQSHGIRTHVHVDHTPASSDQWSFECSRERILQAASCCPLWGRDAWMPAENKARW